MQIELSALEARVIGCLIEKEKTTPEQYPLSLNALTNACNQKTNREPILQLDERAVQETVDALIKKYLVSDKSAGYGGRVTKYKHRFCNTEFGSLKFSPQELGVLCVMLLRGPQTPGELRGRTQRLCEWSDMHQVQAALDALMTRDDGPFIARLPRSTGERESRYGHLFSGEIEWTAPPAPAAAGDEMTQETLLARVGLLEALVAEMRREIEALKNPASAATAKPDRPTDTSP
jgi:uncharacterized protein